MKFGKTDHPELIDFSLPADHSGTRSQLDNNCKTADTGGESPRVYVGCAKWNRQELQNFYPRGIKDELTYYSRQFNTIELNATFYRIFPSSVFAQWKDKTPDNFVFFPKLPQVISHRKRLNAVQPYVEEFLLNARYLDQKLGMVFLQMADNFSPHQANSQNNLFQFIRDWPRDIPLGVELRHTDWYNHPEISETLYRAFEEYGITNIITDTASRRDLLHMRLTTPYAFIRYVGANHESDYRRLDDWVERLQSWIESGIQQIGFFVHQNHELESPLLANYFIEKLNARANTDLALPTLQPLVQQSLFK